MTATAILASEKKRGFLYKLTFPNGKAYIGVTTWSVADRFAEHCANARRKSRGYAVHAAIRKFGPENVKVETLASAEGHAVLSQLEIKAVAEHGTYSPNGYNLTRGGEGMFDLADESKIKRSKALVGRVLGPESRKKIGEAASRQMQCPEARAKLSSLARTRVLSDATKAKISSASKIALASDAMRKKISENTKAGQNKPETKAAMSKRSTANWAKDGARAAHAEKIKAKWADPEWKAKTLLARLEKRQHNKPA